MMKKFIKSLIILIFILIFSSAISYAVTVVKDGVNRKNGLKTTVQNFKTSYDIENNKKTDGDGKFQLYFTDILSHKGVLCGQHGGPFFGASDVQVRVRGWTSIKSNSWITGDPRLTQIGSLMSSKLENVIYGRVPENDNGLTPMFSYDIWSGKAYYGKNDKPSVKGIIAPVQYSGMSLYERLGLDDPTEEKSETTKFNKFFIVQTTGATEFKKTRDISAENDALAYILSECNFNEDDGTFPINSYVNIAFWNWQNNEINGKLKSGTTSALNHFSDYEDLYDQSREIDKQIKELQQERNELLNNIAQWKKIRSDLDPEKDKKLYDAYSNLIRLWSNDVNYRNKCTNEGKIVNDDKGEYVVTIDGKNYRFATKGTKVLKTEINKLKAKKKNLSKVQADETADLWTEAVQFENMWNVINNKYSGEYINTVSTKATNKDDVTVQFDATNQEYRVGPFKINYLEQYTGISNDGNNKLTGTQLCGIAGLPKLWVKIDNKNREDTLAKLEFGKDWNFDYDTDSVSKATPLSDSNWKAGVPNSYNLYPHDGQEFYIKIKYREGMNRFVKLNFEFRRMEASARYIHYDGNIQILNWAGIIKPEGSLNNPKDPGNYINQDSNSAWSECSLNEEHDVATEHQLPSHDSSYDINTKPCDSAIKIMSDNYCHGHKATETKPNGEGGKVYPMFSTNTDGTWKHTGKMSDGTYGYGDCDNLTSDFVRWDCPGHTEKCVPGWKNKDGITDDGHNGFADHYTAIKLLVYVFFDGTITDVQDVAFCPGSSRGYDFNVLYGERNERAMSIDLVYSNDENDGWDLTTKIAGNVWLDGVGQKIDAIHKIDGVKDDGEKGVKNVGITVAIYENGQRQCDAIAHDKSGNRLKWPIYTDENGNYTVERLEAPGGGNLNKNKKYNMRHYAVEFTYDGQTYKSTVYLSTDGTEGTIAKYKANPNNYKKSSMAVESVNSRYAFDTKFGEIRGKDELDANLSTTGLAVKTNILGTTTNESSTKEIKYNGTQGTNPELITSKLDTPGNIDDPSSNKKADGIYAISTSTYCGDDDTHGITVNKENYRILFPVGNVTVYYMNKGKHQRYIEKYMLHINLGLKQRDEVDISLQKDLYKATLVLNGQKVVKEYNRYSGDAENTEYNKFLLNVEKDSANNRYCLGLYKNDLNYQSDNYYGNAMEYIRSIKKGTELRVFVTYSIRIYNNSTTNDVEINGIKDYYDSTYTLVTADEEAPIVNSDLKLKKDIIAEAPFYRIRSTANEDMTWKPNRSELKEGYVNGDLSWTTSSSQINGMKVASTDAFKSMKISKNNFIEIFTTYEVDKEGYENMINDENANMETRVNLISDDKSNIAEVTSYSTFYTNEDLASNGYHPYKAGWISGRVDKNSAPDNIRKSDLKNRKYYENDTFRAQGLDIKVKVTERSTSGYVWEDKKSQELDKYNLSVGDGYYNSSNEKLISGVKVSLYEVINLGTFGSNGVYDGQYDGMDYYYKVPDTWYSISNGGITSGDAKVKIDGTNSSTEYDGNYAISGFLAGDYVVRFDYGVTAGDGEEENVYTYNGQDYENTRFMAELSDDSLNNKFLDITGNTKINGTGTNDLPISKARDNESRRMIVDSYSRNIENDRGEILRDRNSDEFKQNTCMYAETPIVKFDIEDPSKLEITDSEKGENLKERYERSDDTGGNSSIEYTGYTIKNMNFGLEKRAKTDLELTQYIQEIELVKQNDLENPILRVYFDENGDLIKDNVDTINSNKIAYMTHKDQTVDGQGFYASSVENEYLKDLSLLVIYNVNVKNNSEVDFTGRLANLYVASDISGKASALPTENLYKQMKNSMNAEDFDNYLEEANGISGDSTLYKLLELYNNGTASDASLKKLLDGTSRLSDDQKKDDYIRPEVLVYGAYVGRYYYENNLCENEKAYTITNYSYRVDAADINLTYLADTVVKTTVDKVVDYIDVNTSSDYEYNETNYTDHTWEKVGIKKINDNNNDKYVKDFETINGLLSDDSYSDSNKNQILDEKGRELVTDNKYNIIASVNEYIKYTKQNDNKLRAEYISSDDEHISKYNERLTTGLVPEVYKNVNDKNANNIPYYSIANVSVATRKNTSSDEEANEVGLDNLVEILVYSNSTGRRDTDSVPGNAMKIAKTSGFWNAGYNAYSDTNKEVENDAYAADYITIIPPTGIAMRKFIRNNILNIVGLMIALIVMSVIFGFKQFRIKRQYAKK